MSNQYAIFFDEQSEPHLSSNHFVNQLISSDDLLPDSAVFMKYAEHATPKTEDPLRFSAYLNAYKKAQRTTGTEKEFEYLTTLNFLPKELSSVNFEIIDFEDQWLLALFSPKVKYPVNSLTSKTLEATLFTTAAIFGKGRVNSQGKSDPLPFAGFDEIDKNPLHTWVALIRKTSESQIVVYGSLLLTDYSNLTDNTHSLIQISRVGVLPHRRGGVGTRMMTYLLKSFNRSNTTFFLSSRAERPDNDRRDWYRRLNFSTYGDVYVNNGIGNQWMYRGESNQLSKLTLKGINYDKSINSEFRHAPAFFAD